MSSEADIEALIRREVEARLAELLPLKIEEALRARESGRNAALTIIASKGTLDWAYPPFILATTAAALGWQVKVFFTFYGLELLKRDLSGLRISPLGNPALPMKMPFGPDWFRSWSWSIPNLLQAGVPGFEALATRLMHQTLRNHGVADVAELRDLALEAGVELIACQMSLDLLGYRQEELIDGIGYAGAASFLPQAREASVNLFV